MDMIEPNIPALVFFAAFANVSCLGLIVMSGVFPLATRPELARPLGLSLIGLNLGLLSLVLYGTVSFGLDNLRWTSMVIVGGFALLFAPGLFNVWPGKWRDGMAGLTVVLTGLGASALALGALA